jgi:hypothetical protein
LAVRVVPAVRARMTTPSSSTVTANVDLRTNKTDGNTRGGGSKGNKKDGRGGGYVINMCKTVMCKLVYVITPIRS